MIGIFDSGIGGLSVLAAIARVLPRADLVYLADTAHVPYGDKDDAYICNRALRIGRHLVELGCKEIVVACNTATAAAASVLREKLPDIPIVGIEPGVKPAAAASKTGRIAVLTTSSTARSERLACLIKRYAGSVHADILPCPGWATKVETLDFGDMGFAEAARRHLTPTLDAGADQIVLGCTHYAFLAPILQPIVAGRAELIEVADAVAQRCLRLAGETANRNGRLILLDTARPEHLQAALHALDLGWLASRQSDPARLANV